MVSTKPDGEAVYHERNLVTVTHLLVLAHRQLRNYGTRTKPEIKAWLAKQPRFPLHSTPTSGSWLKVP